MRVAVLGAGGIGGYFGGRLAEAGIDVTLIARGAHLAEIQRNGLTLMAPDGQESVVPVPAVAEPIDLGVADAVLICVKTWQLPEALAGMAPLVGPQTALVTLQNGVDAPHQVAEAWGQQAVLPGLAKIFADIDGPGRVRHLGGPASLTFAEWNNQESERVGALRAAVVAAGVSVVRPDDIWVDLWAKFLLGVPIGSLGTVLDATVGVLRSRPGTRRLLESAMVEIHSVGQASGVTFPASIIDDTMAFVDDQPADGIASLHRDFRAGRPTELDAWTGGVVRRGRQAGVRTPIHDVLFEALSLRTENSGHGVG